MLLDYRFDFPLPNGMHARPASQWVDVVKPLHSKVYLSCLRNGVRADARSVLDLIAADIRHGDTCLLEVEGASDPMVRHDFDVLVDYLINTFPHCDEALPTVDTGTVAEVWPRALAALGIESGCLGQAIYPGLAQAPLVSVQGLVVAEDFSWPIVVSSSIEIENLHKAIAGATQQLNQEIQSQSGHAAEILRAQQTMLTDPQFATRVAAHLAATDTCCGAAVLAVVETLEEKLRGGSPYLQERVADLRDLAARLLRALYGDAVLAQGPDLTSPAILVAKDLTPSQFLAIEQHWLRGLVLEQGGATSHTAILARAAGVPMLIGANGATRFSTGTEAILDTQRGVLCVSPNPAIQRFYQREFARKALAKATEATWITRPAQGSDGVAMPILANVANAVEVARAIAHGAQGIGLFRTEWLFMKRGEAPDEETQLAEYSAAIRAAGGRRIVIRTLDIGGDKPLPYLQLPRETNPFLGLRGVRLYKKLKLIIRSQMRALLRAAVHGPLAIMAPMITHPEEMAEFCALVEHYRAELAEEGLACGQEVTLGAMLEIPSAVFSIAEIARHAAFLSIGSNDLAQYFFAADRDNAETTEIGHWQHPAFLRLLQMAVTSARNAACPIGVCGDMASQPEALPILFGLGFDSLSMGAAGISSAKIALSQYSRAATIALTTSAMAAPDRSSASTLVLSAQALRQSAGSTNLVSRALLQLDSTATHKAEVIAELVSMVTASGRTQKPHSLEEALWARESVYSTNFGHGFAVPHCQSDAVSGPVLAVLRLPTAIPWSADAENPVQIALLLAMPAGENRAHLKVFARLSRLIMRDEFRAALATAPDVDALYSALVEGLGPDLV